MNICTYVTVISMSPKIYSIAVDYHTKTFDNLGKTSTAVLQVLNKKNIGLVRYLGKKSGNRVDKQIYLERKDCLTQWKGYPVLKDANAYVELQIMDRKNVKGDHELFWFEAINFRTISEDNVLMFQELVNQKIILS
jgi:flavin reductase (DIM6/NTAB) family NADH-FMN oxidoreductase RutF